MKNIIYPLWILAFVPVSAQSLFAGYVQRMSQVERRVSLTDEEIEVIRLMNPLRERVAIVNIGGVKSESPQRDSVLRHNENERILSGNADSLVVKKTHRYKINGYRIQIYAGGNSRKARIEAEQLGSTCKSYYPELAVYTHFSPPRWVCRVGDFKTLSEAHRYMQIFTKAKMFGEASIVKCQIFVYY